MEEKNGEISKERLLCNICGVQTWHKVVAEYSFERLLEEDAEKVPPSDIDSQEWVMFQCLGCDSITARSKTYLYWVDEPDYDYYPERTSYKRRKKEYQKLPERLTSLYAEVINSYNSNSFLLCTAGIRALLEGLCDDKRIIEGSNEQCKITKNLEGKINGLATIVPAGIVRNLHGLRFLGNQALHELETPTRDDLGLALTIIEDILNVVYDLDYKSQVLYEATARKRPPPKIDEVDPSGGM